MVNVASTPCVGLNTERRFFSATALAGLAVAFVGFMPTYYLMHWFAAPPLPWIVHLHGVLYSGWILLYLMQTTLIATNRRELHKQTGAASLGLAAGMIVLGVVVAVEGARRGVGGPERNQAAFLINPLVNVVMFAGFLIAAIRFRKRAPFHKRLMLLTMLPILTTPLARISRMMAIPVPLPVGGMLLSNIFLIALAVYDFRTLGRLHSATIWGGSILVASQVARVVVGASSNWQDFATALIG